MFPFVCFNWPVSIWIKVVFPAPLGPSKPNVSPFFTLKDTSFSASTLPNVFCMLFTCIIADMSFLLMCSFDYTTYIKGNPMLVHYIFDEWHQKRDEWSLMKSNHSF